MTYYHYYNAELSFVAEEHSIGDDILQMLTILKEKYHDDTDDHDLQLLGDKTLRLMVDNNLSKVWRLSDKQYRQQYHDYGAYWGAMINTLQEILKPDAKSWRLPSIEYLNALVRLYDERCNQKGIKVVGQHYYCPLSQRVGFLTWLDRSMPSAKDTLRLQNDILRYLAQTHRFLRISITDFQKEIAYLVTQMQQKWQLNVQVDELSLQEFVTDTVGVALPARQSFYVEDWKTTCLQFKAHYFDDWLVLQPLLDNLLRASFPDKIKIDESSNLLHCYFQQLIAKYAQLANNDSTFDPYSSNILSIVRPFINIKSK